MKKTIFAALLLLTLLLTTACGQKNSTADTQSQSTSAVSGDISLSTSDTDSQPSAETPSAAPAVEEATFNSTKDYTDTIVQRYVDVSKLTDKTKAQVVDILNGSTFYMDISGSVQLAKGLSSHFDGVMAKDGDNRYFRTVIAGQTTAILQNDSGTYSLDETAKTAHAVSADEASGTSAFYSNQGAMQMFSKVMSTFGQDPLTYVQNGTEAFEGTSCLFEEYAVGEAVIKLYYDGNTPKAITLTKGDFAVTVTVKALMPQADLALFQIPDGYTVQ